MHILSHIAESSPMVDLNNHHFEVVVDGLSFPTSVTFHKSGTIAYVTESGLPFGDVPPSGRIWQIDISCIAESSGHYDTNGSINLNNCIKRSILADGLRQPVNGLTFHDNKLYVSEGDRPGRIITLDPNTGQQTAVILDNLPGPGNHHTNMVAFGRNDGKLYLSQGALTNTGIVRLDAYERRWLCKLLHAHDIPGYGVVLAGANITTSNPFANYDDGEKEKHVKTGAFAPFGTETEPRQRIKAQLPCIAAIMRCNPDDGSNLELVAWGLRNAYGIGFLPDGRLIATDQGADDRGSRPVGNAPDLLYEVRKDAWYGWPDFIGGEPITDAKYLPQRGTRPTFVLTNHEELPPPEKPLLRFSSNVAAAKFDLAPASLLAALPSCDNTKDKENGQQKNGMFRYVALFGDEKPITTPSGSKVGRAIRCINPDNWTICATLRNNELMRPIDVRYNPIDGYLYVLDFGKFEIKEDHSISAEPQSGKLWIFVPG